MRLFYTHFAHRTSYLLTNAEQVLSTNWCVPHCETRCQLKSLHRRHNDLHRPRLLFFFLNTISSSSTSSSPSLPSSESSPPSSATAFSSSAATRMFSIASSRIFSCPSPC